MNKNEPIQIKVVANGFIVTPATYHHVEVPEDEDTKVFSTSEELHAFITDHFTKPHVETIGYEAGQITAHSD